ncbi:MAG: phosphate regulon transcriptional regulator PhoB [Hydrogenophaga sp.]|uniref:phosphate regulon transcriptional regulator PhoB n=1 Tax=Hydrogenophaga sp. TaxID=1904254 RepID=UPI00257D4005|nr:phosphate regulon transcriptional regulator PhoB [Hydrogenophaga sp.]MBL0943583.1 phosphate regulon transcriptional regulator PhoB [Hydrogenophaga sp.]
MAAQILVVEDEPAIQDLLRANLLRAGHEVRCADAAERAREMFTQWQPDLVLLDWGLPGMSGVDFLRLLRGDPKLRDVPVILLSARSEERDKIAGLEVGADDYITKPFSTRELIARIGVVLRRRAPQVNAEVVRLGSIVLDPAAMTVSAAGMPLNIGGTEFRLLHFLITHADRVYSRSQLLDHVWGSHYVGDDRTVDVHISRLRNALLPAGMDRMIRTIRGSGYSFNVNGTV